MTIILIKDGKEYRVNEVRPTVTKNKESTTRK